MKKLKLPIVMLLLAISFIFASCANESKPGDRQDNPQNLPDTVAAVQTDTTSASDGIPTDVESIRKVYAATMTQMENGLLDSMSFKYSCNEEKRGTVTYFSKGGQLRMIVHHYSEYDHHHAVDRYFIKDSAVFFVYTNKVLWSFEDGPAQATKDNVTELRSYIVNGKPIKCLEKKFVVRSANATNPDPENVANKEISCNAFKSMMQTYQTLEKHRNNPTSGCLEK